MNDFTKEELEILRRSIEYWLGEYSGGIIKDKLQSLIDNYCEPHVHRFYPSIMGKNWECDCGAFEDDFTEDERGVL